MKNTMIILIALSFLLQSCYSYKVIDVHKTPLIAEKKYKIMQSNKYENIRLLSSTESTVTVSNLKNVQNTIAIKDIKKMKKRKFSVAKTSVLVITSLLGGAIIIVADGLSNTNYTPK